MRSLGILIADLSCSIKAKAQADYERQQRENEEIRLRMAQGGGLGSGRKLTEARLTDLLSLLIYRTQARIHLDPEQAAEYVSYEI